MCPAFAVAATRFCRSVGIRHWAFASRASLRASSRFSCHVAMPPCRAAPLPRRSSMTASPSPCWYALQPSRASAPIRSRAQARGRYGRKNGRNPPFVHPDLLARLDGHQRRARDTRHQPSSLRLRGRMCARTQQLHAACHTCHSVCSMPCVALYDTWRRAAVYDSCHVDAMRMPCVVRYAICHNLCCCVVCHISP